jgi:hypothetical protein
VQTTNDERRQHVPNPPTGSWQSGQKKGGAFEIDARTRSRLSGQIKGKHTLFRPSSVHPFTSIARSTPLHSIDPYIIKPAVSRHILRPLSPSTCSPLHTQAYKLIRPRSRAEPQREKIAASKMSEVKATNPADGKVANPKVMLNLGSLPPRQKPSAMMREQVSLASLAGQLVSPSIPILSDSAWSGSPAVEQPGPDR